MVSGRGGIPVVAIVGRPNVGKSTLFNRFLGQRSAIVEDRARTTRDRLYGDTEWNGRRFVIVDTGGLELEPDDPIEARVQEQARLAIAEADVILFVVDAVSGLTPADLEAAAILRRAKRAGDRRRQQGGQREARARRPPSSTPSAGTRPTRSRPRTAAGPATCSTRSSGRCRPRARPSWRARPARLEADAWADEVAAGRLEPYVVGDADAEADELDDDEVDPTDAEARRWDAAMAADADGEPAAIAFVGRPNVGKSSLLNALLGEDRAIVSEIPGTTRDAIDTRLAWGRSEVVLIDTAGIRRRGKVASGPAAERYSTLRALHALSRADVAVLVIDAVEGLTARMPMSRATSSRRARAWSSRSTSGTWSRTRRTARSTSTSNGSATRSRSSTSPRSSRSAPRPASGSAASSRPRSTSGASGASGSRPASSTGS